MSCKQDLISAAMRERIAQLETELQQCKHSLREAVEQKGRLECNIEALQVEAHDVVAQWVAKTSELQTKYDGSVSQIEQLQSELLVSESKNTELRGALKEAETANFTQAEELQRLKKSQEESVFRLEIAYGYFSLLFHQVVNLENVVQQKDLEIKQSLEHVKNLLTNKSMLTDAVAKHCEEKVLLAATCSELKSLVAFLKDDVSRSQKTLGVLVCTTSLAEEENCARRDMILFFFAYYFDLLVDYVRHYMFCILLAESKCKRLENDVSALRNENSSLHEGLELTHTQLLSIKEEYVSVKEDFHKQTRLLEENTAEFQDFQITQGRLLKSLQEKLEDLSSEYRLLKVAKEDLATEFGTIKECYSGLLLEHNDFKTFSHKQHENLNTTIALLSKENETLKGEFEMRLRDVCNQNINLCRLVEFTSVNSLVHEEQNERMALKTLWQEGCIGLLLTYNETILNFLKLFYKQNVDIKEELRQRDKTLKAKKSEMENFCIHVDALEREIFLKKEEVVRLEFNVSQLSSQLELSKKTCEDAVNDNTWLKEQVESMRRELGDLDELLNSNLNDMREESERQTIDCERLMKDISRYEELLQQSQEKIALLNGRCAALTAENFALLKTVTLTEEELLSTKKAMESMHQREIMLVERKTELELKLLQFQKEHVFADSQKATLFEHIRTQEAKLQLLSLSTRQEIDAMKIKMNGFIEKYEEASERAFLLSKRLQETENTHKNLQGAYQKAKTALEEAKQRCRDDTETIQKLLSERQTLEKKLEDVLERYNCLYEMLRDAKKENLARAGDEMHMLSDLCFQQEVELQEIRRQNILLKRGIMKLPECISTGSQAERPVFVERLNLSEGPLRRPKKRAAIDLDVEKLE